MSILMPISDGDSGYANQLARICGKYLIELPQMSGFSEALAHGFQQPTAYTRLLKSMFMLRFSKPVNYLGKDGQY